MAVSSITLKRKDITRQHVRRQIAIQLNGAYGNPETIDFTTMLNPQRIPKGKFGAVANSPSSLPANDDCYSVQIPGGYDAVLAQAAANPTLKNYTLTFYTSGGAALGGGNLPAGLVGVDIVLEIITPLKRD